MKIRLVNVFGLLTLITSILNLLLESKVLCFINIIVVMIFTILVFLRIKDDKEED